MLKYLSQTVPKFRLFSTTLSLLRIILTNVIYIRTAMLGKHVLNITNRSILLFNWSVICFWGHRGIHVLLCCGRNFPIGIFCSLGVNASYIPGTKRWMNSIAVICANCWWCFGASMMSVPHFARLPGVKKSYISVRGLQLLSWLVSPAAPPWYKRRLVVDATLHPAWELSLQGEQNTVIRSSWASGTRIHEYTKY